MAASISLTPEQRTRRASAAARARWADKTPEQRRSTLLGVHVRAVVDRIDELSAEQLSMLAQRVAASRAAQGLPPVVTDPATLDRAATVLRLAGT